MGVLDRVPNMQAETWHSMHSSSTADPAEATDGSAAWSVRPDVQPGIDPHAGCKHESYADLEISYTSCLHKKIHTTFR